MQPIIVDPKSTGDEKNELIEEIVTSPLKGPRKVNNDSKSRYFVENYDKKIKLENLAVFAVNDTEIFSVRFDPEDNVLAAGTLDGVIKVYNLVTKKIILNLISSPSYTPSTCFRWRPNTYDSQTKGVLLAANSDGSITQWHVSTGKQLVKIGEVDNQIFALDYYYDGKMFATAGKDTKIRIYDEETKQIKQTLKAIQWQSPGHTNRVFSIKFINQDDPNTLISGGWDSNLHFWDLRTSKTYNTILGPNISGDSIDYKDGIIITGSHRSKDYLQLWDYKTQSKINDISWEYGYSAEGAYIYSAQFNKIAGNNYLVCGCSGLNEAKIFDLKNSCKPVSKVTDLKKGIYTVDFGNTTNKIAMAGGDGIIYVFNLNEN